MYIAQIIKTLLKMLTKTQRAEFYTLTLFFIFSAFIQIVGIASIAPFITLLSDQSIVHSNKFFNYAYKFSGAESESQFTILFALASLALIFVSNLISVVTLWLLIRFSVTIGAQIQSDLFNNYLHREYVYHKSENYNEIISVISQETPRFVYMVLQPFLLLISQSMVAAIIIVGLIAISPSVAFSSAAILGGAYLITYISVKKSLNINGTIMSDRNSKMQSILSESFIGIKDLKLSHTEEVYLTKLKQINLKGLKASASIALTGDIPKFVIETVAFGAILLLAIFALLKGDNGKDLIALLSIYAIAGYKLLPTMQQVYKSISAMSANGPVVDTLYRELNYKSKEKDNTHTRSKIDIQSIDAENIDYTYPNTKERAIRNISLNLSKGKIYTIAGHSGSGKSTLADVLLGLLENQEGQIKINNVPLSEFGIEEYQNNLAYVAQNIFILDSTVTKNVAFGAGDEEIDDKKVAHALQKARANDFVAKLPNGANTQLGQDGKLLSGGQRQRIAIARALYQQSSVLILDEPTSALDIESEYEIMQLLQELKKDMLILVISHRPSAIKLSDQVILLDNGIISSNDSFANLIEKDAGFRALMDKGFGNHTNTKTIESTQENSRQRNEQ
ncbi:ABC transporter ATP-binding protein [Simiduia curdlanivorans]|uniref:ABC transporter ATP-binding protein n=1 Tax=Simiduia curdlanivorans TaxID=1492769 RepID=A0ABV8VB40_9GAMM|nr:ABC transporter ATP-binding protein [Simiduia curdlanivorans]MDN3638508.1 ABC transporter ATP-binding protein [Simiduia curdlanivorans]